MVPMFTATVSLAHAESAALVVRSPVERVALIELFTSEGCSSCPPAEAWLGRLRESPELWREFVPIAFHVHYWDNLGWRDRWASPEFTDRQRRYSQAWRANTIYTPALVKNGREWRDWRHDRAARDVRRAGELVATSTDGLRWQIGFTPAAPLPRAEVHAALLVSGVESRVTAGENRGRRLAHEFVAAGLKSVALTPRDGGLHGEITLSRPDALPGEARLALAVWITRPGEVEPLQAAGGWLELR